jgi:hypothetical protein
MEEIGILKSKTKQQHLEDIISQIDVISNKLDKAKGDWMIATYELSFFKGY